MLRARRSVFWLKSNESLAPNDPSLALWNRLVLRLILNERPLVAESGSQNLAFPMFLRSALHPKAAVELIGW